MKIEIKILGFKKLAILHFVILMVKILGKTVGYRANGLNAQNRFFLKN